MTHVHKLGWVLAALVSIAAIAAIGRLATADPLDPPGPVAVTGRTQLFQPAGCGTFPVAITLPGSYVLAQNIEIPAACGKNGIEILASNVDLDLNGFTVGGVIPGSLAGITDAGVVRDNLTIRNGMVLSWGGAGLDFATSFHVTVRDLQSNYNGFPGGIILGGAAQVTNCRAYGNTGTGIFAGPRSDLFACNADGNTSFGFYLVDATLSHCNATGNSGIGIFATDSTIHECVASRNGNDGILAFGSSLSSCTARSNGFDGIQAEQSTITNCTANGNLAFGMLLVRVSLTGGNAYDNTLDGIRATESIVTECHASDNGLDGILSISSEVSRCVSQFNAGDGIEVDLRSAILDNDVFNNSTNGIRVTGSDNRIEGNNVVANAAPQVNVTVAGNTIVKNSASGAAPHFSIAVGNTAGPTETSLTPLTNPWANISY